MEAIAFIDKIEKTGENKFNITFSLFTNNSFLKLLKSKNEEKTLRDQTGTYAFILGIYDDSYHMEPLGELQACMELYSRYGSGSGLNLLQQQQWCAGAMTEKIINDIISSEVLKPFSYLDLSGTPALSSSSNTGTSPVTALQDKAKDIENSVEAFLEFLEAIQAVPETSDKVTWN